MMQTNFEHYKDEILKITNFGGGGLGMLKSDRTLISCDAIKCEDCVFDCIRTNPRQMTFNCKYRLLEWAASPFVPLITMLENDFLKNYATGYKYIYRKDNYLYLAKLPLGTDDNVIYGISDLDIKFRNIQEGECYVIEDLLAAYTPINCERG
jgi:hypothetical protein